MSYTIEVNDLHAQTQQLLQRTFIHIPFGDFLRIVEHTYPSIGRIEKYEPICEGYESANFILHAQYGKYVLKIFESDRDVQNIRDLFRIMENAQHLHIPVLKNIDGVQGILSQYVENGRIVWFSVTEFFDGTSFQNVEPSIEEMVKVSTYIATLNTLSFPVREAYDSWGNKNLVQEYDQIKHILSSQVSDKVIQTVEEMRTIPFQEFPRAVIHGDMQRKHVLKNKLRELRIIDFGCAAYDVRVIDLSTCIAWFCLSQNNRNDWGSIFQSVTQSYEHIIPLDEREKRALPACIEASYAAYFLKTSQLITEGDDSKETKEWNTLSLSLLDLFREWRAKQHT